jgi:predicted dithiol-disulfide oxidoreductase (DUF899 family)
VQVGRPGGRLHLARATALVPQRVQAAICRDAVRPGTLRGSPIESFGPAPGGQQRLLEKVLGVLKRAQNPVAVQLELPTVRVDELAERLLVSRAGAGERSLGHHGILAWRFVPAPSGVQAIRPEPTKIRSETKHRDDKGTRVEIGGKAMTQHKVGTQGEWQAARDELLAEEKELTRRNDELARKRRELPWVPVEKEYSFETADGTKSLTELFDGHSQLLIYHFMFGPEYAAGCPVCSSIADNLDPNAIHLAARDVKLMLVSRAPLEKLQGYRKRMGWSLDWASTVGSEFNRELGFLYTEEELKPFLEGEVPPAVEHNAEACGVDAATYVSEGPGLSAYILSDGTVYRTYLTTARGLEPAMGYYGLLDRTPIGRNEEGEEVFWLRRHDEYEDAPSRATT